MNKGSFVNTLPLQLRNLIMNSAPAAPPALDASTVPAITAPAASSADGSAEGSSEGSSEGTAEQEVPDASAQAASQQTLEDEQLQDIGKVQPFLMSKLQEQKGIIFTEFNDIQLKLFDVDSTLSPAEFDAVAAQLDPQNQILLCEKVKLIYGFNSLTPFIVRLINILNFSTFFSIFDITSNIKLYGFYSLNYTNPVEILVKQIRHDLFIVKSFKEFTIQEMKKEHDFHLPYKEFKRLNLNDGNLVVVKILFKNEQKPIDLQLIKPLLPRTELLHLSLESEAKLRPFNELIDQYGTHLKYLKFGVNRGTFKKIPIKNSIETMKLVNIDNLNFINDLKQCQSLDVFFDNWELRKNCDIKFQENFIIKFDVRQRIQNLRTLNIFHTYLDSKDLSKLKLFPNLTYSKISYVILDNEGFDMSECKNLQELKIHFTYHKPVEEPPVDEDDRTSNIQWPPNCKKLSITIHNIKNLIQNFSIRLNILRKIAKPLPPSIIDLCIDISYDTGGSGPELYSISRDDILKISMLINQILTHNLENLKLKGISRYNYKIGKPLIFSAINFPPSLKLLSLNDFILDYNFINLPKLKKLYFEHSLFDSDFRLPDADEILIEKCTFKDLAHLPSQSSKIEFKMCTFRKIPSYNGDVSNVVINNCRVMEQPTNNIFQFQQQLQMNHQDGEKSYRKSQSQQQQQQQQQHRNGGGNQMKPMPNGSSPRSAGANGRNGNHNQGRRQNQPQHSHHSQHQHPQPPQQQGPQHSNGAGMPPSANKQVFSSPFAQQTGVRQYPMFPSSSFSNLSSSSVGSGVSPMKPSSSVSQLMGNGQYDYLGQHSDLSNFIDKDLEFQLNGLTLSQPGTTSSYLGSKTRQMSSSSQLSSFGMTPSSSSASIGGMPQQQDRQPVGKQGGQSVPNSAVSSRQQGYANFIPASAFAQSPLSPMQAAQGYGPSSFDNTFVQSPSQTKFGFFVDGSMQANNSPGATPYMQGRGNSLPGQLSHRGSFIAQDEAFLNSEQMQPPPHSTGSIRDSF